MNIDLIFWMLTGFAFALGAVVGSFLNVAIHRVPAGLSVVSPPSHCPACESQIRWYDNIPIISWGLLLRGKCRDCAAPISARYAVVEALTGLLAAALFAKVALPFFESTRVFAQTPPVNYLLPFGLYFVFMCLLVAITFVDLEHLLVPHEFTLPGIVLGLATPWIFNAFLGPGALAEFWPKVTPAESLIGAIAGGLTVVAIFYGYYAVRGRVGIGGGDVTLMALVGAWLGWPALVFIFFAASMQGTVAAVVAMMFGSAFLRDSDALFEEDGEGEGEDEDKGEGEPEAADAPKADAPLADTQKAPSAVPFGPFIALAALEHLLIGDWLPSAVSMAYLYQFGYW